MKIFMKMKIHENFVIHTPLDKEVTVKFWKLSGSGVQIQTLNTDSRPPTDSFGGHGQGPHGLTDALIDIHATRIAREVSQ